MSMTTDQLKHLEADLERRGYKKWTKCLVGSEDYAWFKSFGVHEDADGDLDRDYQIAFRITDWMRRDPYDRPERASVGVTVTMIPSGLNNRYCIVEREKVMELCSLTAENSGSIDYGLIDGLTDLVCDMFNEEYHATIDNGTSMFNQNEEENGST